MHDELTDASRPCHAYESPQKSREFTPIPTPLQKLQAICPDAHRVPHHRLRVNASHRHQRWLLAASRREILTKHLEWPHTLDRNAALHAHNLQDSIHSLIRVCEASACDALETELIDTLGDGYAERNQRFEGS